MSIHRAVTALLIVPFFVVSSTAQTSPTRSPTSSSPLPHLHMSPEVRAIVGACIAVGVVLIVVASYFCCCHAACRGRRAKHLDAEDQIQQRDVGVQTMRTSTDKDKDDNDNASTITDAPPREMQAEIQIQIPRGNVTKEFKSPGGTRLHRYGSS
ncbi:hypothetical protein C8R45DRAFT_1192961 [Mycena sanguinolenta]|nr:hypothetical protein C8R45DRAFT_1192961 [Mycena sanguinolenta]